MCGISGYFGNKNNRPSDQSILKTLEQMKIEETMVLVLIVTILITKF